MLGFGRKIAVLALMSVAAASFGQVVNLVNDGSTASINAGTGTQGNQGLFDWRIGGGPNFAVQQVYAFRVGTGAVNTVNTISAPTIVQPTPDLADIAYTSGANLFDITFRYLLTGGSPNSSDLAEVTTLVNRGTTALTFSLYEYDFFRPGGVIGGTGTLLNSSTIRLANAGGSITVGATNIPDRWEIGPSATVVTDLLSGTLSNANSPFTSATDISFGFQWNVVVAPGQTWQMSKNKLIAPVPEPATLVTVGSLALLAIRRRRARK